MLMIDIERIEEKIQKMRVLISLTMVLIPFVGFSADFVKGADISWVNGQEQSGTVFRDTLGRTRDILDILKNDYQINTIRLRVFVNPSDDKGNGLCDIAATVEMAKRVQQAGMHLMLTLHYSDSWADPGKQNPPAAWSGYSAEQLETVVYNHTKEVMEALAAENIYPVMVQTGNETNNGMLWDSGKASTNMANYARFVTAGHNAVKEISPETRTVVHISNGFDDNLYTWNIGGLIANNARFDIIGMSAYPEYRNNTTVDDWQDFNNDVYANITSLIASYGKQVIIAETGMHYTAEEQCRKMIADMVAKLRDIEDDKGLGVLYWEPQAGPGYNHGYNLGAWGADGRPTKALNGFIEEITSTEKRYTGKNSLMERSSNTFIVHGFSDIKLPDEFADPVVSVYSTDGKVIYNNMFIGQIHRELPNGTYFIKANGSRKQLLARVLVFK